MSKRKAFYVPSKLPPFPNKTCDKCPLVIADVQDGSMYWNPNDRAYFRDICKNCFDVWENKRNEAARKYRDEYCSLKFLADDAGGGE